MDRHERLLEVLGSSTLSASQLRRALGISQPTLSRMLRSAGATVVRMGRGRATHYAAARPVFGDPDPVPLYTVDDRGRVTERAHLFRSADGRYYVDPRTSDFWWLGESGTGLFPGLPYFIEDARPSGFLGRLIARRVAEERRWSGDAREWTDEQLGQFLLRDGFDLIGNLVVGEGAAEAARNIGIQTIDDRATAYPELARLVLQGTPPASSAAGEQPKFLAHLRDAGHVIVKFSPTAAGPDAIRWRDLLRSEHHALATIAAHGLPAIESSVHECAGRIFLEARRFDRIDAIGRVGSISLAVIDAEFVGAGSGWSRVASGLLGAGRLDRQDVKRIAWLETFGQWIGNSDMHLGNLSLRPESARFALHPAYDMLPMAYAPSRGEQPTVSLRAPIRTASNDTVWETSRKAAVEFWERVSADRQVSESFRTIARDNLRVVRQSGA